MELRAAVAVDWSGARAGGPRRTWMAEVAGDRLVELSGGWTADALAAWLEARAGRDPDFAVGLDFAFGFPAWFVLERFGGRPEVAWERAVVEGEAWLAELQEPFWGRAGHRRPPADPARPQLRATEVSRAGTGRGPGSIFQVGGAGAVGTGSIRGMPLLRRLRAAGFAIWPFDPPAAPLVVEIYPRALTGPVVKSRAEARTRYLDELAWPADAALRARAAATEDAFDAAVSALRMWRHRAELRELPEPSPAERVEGRIWVPPERRPWRRTWDQPASLADEWRSVAPRWVEWARRPGHDSYWRFHRDRFLDLLPPPPCDVVDLGCGEGRLSRDLGRLGHRVVGVDVAPVALRAAREADPGGRYVLADACRTGLATGCADLVVAFMSLQDVDDMPGAVAEARRLLRPGGRLCIAVVHPLNSAGEFESLDPEAAFRIEGSYLSERLYRDEGGRDGLVMRFSSAHRPLESYFRALEAAGFLVERLREIPSDEGSAAERADRGRWRRLPLFLHVRAVAPSA